MADSFGSLAELQTTVADRPVAAGRSLSDELLMHVEALVFHGTAF
jgi:hypothetical protein